MILLSLSLDKDFLYQIYFWWCGILLGMSPWGMTTQGGFFIYEFIPNNSSKKLYQHVFWIYIWYGLFFGDGYFVALG